MGGPAARLIGGMFLERGLISHDQLEIALETQHLTGQLLGEILVAHGWITRMDLADALAEHWRDKDAAAAVDDNVFDLDHWREQVERAHDAPVPAASFVALAQTPGRYRLIECEGTVPQIGDRIELPGLEDTFMVFRQVPSPLPLDDRPCIYVEAAPRTGGALTP